MQYSYKLDYKPPLILSSLPGLPVLGLRVLKSYIRACIGPIHKEIL